MDDFQIGTHTFTMIKKRPNTPMYMEADRLGTLSDESSEELYERLQSAAAKWGAHTIYVDVGQYSSLKELLVPSDTVAVPGDRSGPNEGEVKKAIAEGIKNVANSEDMIRYLQEVPQLWFKMLYAFTESHILKPYVEKAIVSILNDRTIDLHYFCNAKMSDPIVERVKAKINSHLQELRVNCGREVAEIEYQISHAIGLSMPEELHQDIEKATAPLNLEQLIELFDQVMSDIFPDIQTKLHSFQPSYFGPSNYFPPKLEGTSIYLTEKFQFPEMGEALRNPVLMKMAANFGQTLKKDDFQILNEIYAAKGGEGKPGANTDMTEDHADMILWYYWLRSLVNKIKSALQSVPVLRADLRWSPSESGPVDFGGGRTGRKKRSRRSKTRRKNRKNRKKRTKKTRRGPKRSRTSRRTLRR